jgi:tetratricopeptide (TPR) repeat protein
LEKIGMVLEAQSDLAGALTAYHESLEIMRELSLQRQDDTGWRREVSVRLYRVGNVLADQQKPAEALAAYHESLDIRREVSAKVPDNLSWRQEISMILFEIGRVLQSQGDSAGALDRFHESLDIEREVSAKNPANTMWQTEAVKLLVTLAIAGDDPRGRLSDALTIMNGLRSQGRLQPAQLRWIAEIESQLVKLPQAVDPYSPKTAASPR